MGVRKYLFWKSSDGIKTYKVTDDGKAELMMPHGKDTYRNKDDLSKYSDWFCKAAGFTSDDLIDFCYLYENEADENLPELKIGNAASAKSSWSLPEIKLFCEQYIKDVNVYQVFYDTKGNSFCQQRVNNYDDTKIKKLFVKCIPELLVEMPEKISTGSEDTSVLYDYFMEEQKKWREQ